MKPTPYPAVAQDSRLRPSRSVSFCRRSAAAALTVIGLLTAVAKAQTPAAVPSGAPDGTKMDKDAIVEKWKGTPAPSDLRPRGGLTRSARPATPAPVVRTRSIGLSAEALKANAGAIQGLIPRGIVKLTAAEAARAQDQQDASGTTPPPREERSRPATAPSLPAAVFNVPVAPDKQIAFRLHFEKNSTAFDDPAEGIRQVATIAAAMKNLPESTCFLLEGHTCDLGEHAYNQKLSESRALTVRSLLASHGVNPARLLAAGFGESQCEIPNDSEAHRAQNRRVVVGPIELPPPF